MLRPQYLKYPNFLPAHGGCFETQHRSRLRFKTSTQIQLRGNLGIWASNQIKECIYQQRSRLVKPSPLATGSSHCSGRPPNLRPVGFQALSPPAALQSQLLCLFCSFTDGGFITSGIYSCMHTTCLECKQSNMAHC